MITINSMMKQYNIVHNVKEARIGGWSNVFQQFRNQYNSYSGQTLEEKEIFSDLFFSYCLESIDIARESQRLWEIIEQWYECRKMPSRCGNLSSQQQLVLLYFCKNLRKKLNLYFSQTTLGEIAPLTDKQQVVMIAVWRQIFLNAFSPLNLERDSEKIDNIGETILADTKASWYPKIILASMYAPFSVDVILIDVAKLWTLSTIPMWCKVIIICWLISTPYFNSREKHRKKILHYCSEFCKAAMQYPQLMSRGSYAIFTEEIMAGLWRTAYIGGNNINGISIFGDFIHFFMKRYHPQYGQVQFGIKNQKNNKKIRIGYISRNFGNQAVSYYMVNRIIHHDKTKFEVYTFAVGDRNDQMTKIFKQNSGKFIRFNNLNNLDHMANSIINSNLDILIYADIGMDPITNMLAGLQLAPVQCALVGHGTTTGLPTIQYYISGDFEPWDGDAHYREKLIRLPNLGASQYPQEKTIHQISREKFNIPADAVVLISCANGIKHGPVRNRLLIEILQKAPNAWIILKPFQNPTSVNHLFTQRIMQAARVAGVSNRLVILPPLPQAKDIMGLLSVADIQLDTYPYGGWTTNMEALYMGLPIVTQEGDLMRNRWGAQMLRALGIQEGIAQNEAEYVAWAVKMVRDKELRIRLRNRIKNQVMDVLFDGVAAQLPYEEVLLNIIGGDAQVACGEADTPDRNDTILIATSVAPTNIENQRKAISGWKLLGFDVISINASDEIQVLQPHFPDITFIVADRDAREKFGKPYIYFDDILDHFSNNTTCSICGIVNSDIHLIKPGLFDFVKKHGKDSFIFGSRVDVTDLENLQGEVFNGFDYFFFDRKVIECYPEEAFCLGQPWWDAWAPIVPILKGIPTKRIIGQFAYHIKHNRNYSVQSWSELGSRLFKYIKTPFPGAAVNVGKLEGYIRSLTHQHAQMIEFNGEEICEMHVGEDGSKLSENSYKMLTNEVEQAFLQVMRDDSFEIKVFVKIFERIFKGHGFRNEHLINASHAKKILVLRLDEIGDVILTTAFLREMRRAFPNANITLVVKPQVYNMVELCPYVDQVLTFDWQKKRGQTTHDIFLRITSLCREWLWAKGFDLCIMPRYDSDTYFSTLLGYLSGAKMRIGYSEQTTRNKRRINIGYDTLLTDVILGGKVKHEVERNLDVLRYMGYKIGDKNLELWTDKLDDKFAEKYLGECEQLKVVFSPGVGPNRRVWPIERYIELSHWLQQRYHAKIILLGGVGEESSGIQIMQALPESVMNFIGKTTLRQTAAIIKECDIYVGRNTGIMHMAAAVDKPVIEISCQPRIGDQSDAISPIRFGPWGVPTMVLQPQQFLAPCRGTCHHQKAHCILGVTTESARRAVEMILQLRKLGERSC